MLLLVPKVCSWILFRKDILITDSDINYNDDNDTVVSDSLQHLQDDVTQVSRATKMSLQVFGGTNPLTKDK